MKPVAFFYSGYMTIEILECNGELVTWKWADEKKVHYTKVYYGLKRPYFRANEFGRIYLDQCLRLEAV